MDDTCQHGNKAPVSLMKKLPITQAGIGRHKCPVCSYQEGYVDGFLAATQLIQDKIPKSKEDILLLKESQGLNKAQEIALKIKKAAAAKN